MVSAFRSPDSTRHKADLVVAPLPARSATAIRERDLLEVPLQRYLLSDMIR